jgi:hypothetical protein
MSPWSAGRRNSPPALSPDLFDDHADEDDDVAGEMERFGRESEAWAASALGVLSPRGSSTPHGFNGRLGDSAAKRFAAAPSGGAAADPCVGPYGGAALIAGSAEGAWGLGLVAVSAGSTPTTVRTRGKASAHVAPRTPPPPQPPTPQTVLRFCARSISLSLDAVCIPPPSSSPRPFVHFDLCAQVVEYDTMSSSEDEEE